MQFLNNKSRRVMIALGTCFLFLMSELSAFGQLITAAPPVISERTARAELAVQLPSDLGTVEAVLRGQGPVLFHIQEAHGERYSQKKIRKILDYLYEHYGVRHLFLEGDAAKLHPEFLRFFPDQPDWSREAAEQLFKSGHISGPELYLALNPEVTAAPLEQKELYESNLRAFKEVLEAREKSREFLKQLDLQIKRLSAPYLSADLRHWTGRLEDYQNGRIPFENWLTELQKQAAGCLKLQIDSPQAQGDWPMLTRVMTLRKIEEKINPAAFIGEQKMFIKAIRRFVTDELSRETERQLQEPINRGRLPFPETEIFFEKLAASLPENFDYARYPQVMSFVGHLILQSELEAQELIREMDRLQGLISGKLAATPKAKKLVELLEKYRLLEKLFSLELTGEEYEAIITRDKSQDTSGEGKRGENLIEAVSDEPSIKVRRLKVKIENRAGSKELRPSKLIQKFIQLNDAQRVLDLKIQNLEPIDALYEKSLGFYRLARQRDGVMLERLEKTINVKGLDKAVVITGGFHSQPFLKHFSKKERNYILITPAMKGGTGRENYVQAILKNYHPERDPESSTVRLFDEALTPVRRFPEGWSAKTSRDAMRHAVTEALRRHQQPVQPRLGQMAFVLDQRIRSEELSGSTSLKTRLSLPPARAEVRGLTESQKKSAAEAWHHFDAAAKNFTAMVPGKTNFELSEEALEDLIASFERWVPYSESNADLSSQLEREIYLGVDLIFSLIRWIYWIRDENKYKRFIFAADQISKRLIETRTLQLRRELRLPGEHGMITSEERARLADLKPALLTERFDLIADYLKSAMPLFFLWRETLEQVRPAEEKLPLFEAHTFSVELSGKRVEFRTQKPVIPPDHKEFKELNHLLFVNGLTWIRNLGAVLTAERRAEDAGFKAHVREGLADLLVSLKLGQGGAMDPVGHLAELASALDREEDWEYVDEVLAQIKIKIGELMRGAEDETLRFSLASFDQGLEFVRESIAAPRSEARRRTTAKSEVRSFEADDKLFNRVEGDASIPLAIRYLDLFFQLAEEKVAIENQTGDRDFGFDIPRKGTRVSYTPPGAEQVLLLATDFRFPGAAQDHIVMESDYPIWLESRKGTGILAALYIAADKEGHEYLKLEVLRKKRNRSGLEPFDVLSFLSDFKMQGPLIVEALLRQIPLSMKNELVLRASVVEADRIGFQRRSEVRGGKRLSNDEVKEMVRRLGLKSKSNKYAAQREEAIQKLYEHFEHRRRQSAEDRFYGFKYLAEKIAGVPFPYHRWEWIREELDAMRNAIVTFDGKNRSELYARMSYSGPNMLMRERARQVLDWSGSNIWLRFSSLFTYFPSDSRQGLFLTSRQVRHLFLKALSKKDRSRLNRLRRQNSELIHLSQNPEMSSWLSQRAVWDTAVSGFFGQGLSAASVLSRLLRGLTYREREIVKLRDGLGDGASYTLEEVGRVFKLTRERVRQIHAKARRKLMIYAERMMLKDPSLKNEDEFSESQVLERQQRALKRVEQASMPVFSSGEQRRAGKAQRIRKEALLRWIKSRLSPEQRPLIPYVLRQSGVDEAARELGKRNLEAAYIAITRKFRRWLTLGMLERFGSRDQVMKELEDYFSQSKLAEMFGADQIDEAFQLLNGDLKMLAELLYQLYPDLVTAKAAEEMVKAHFKDIPSLRLPSGQPLDPSGVIRKFSRFAGRLGAGRAARREVVLRRLMRSAYYPLIRRDEEQNGHEGLRVLDQEITQIQGSAETVEVARRVLQSTSDYYHAVRSFVPRGFREEQAGGVLEPLLPAQRFAVWEAVQTLQDPHEHNAILTSEARIGKTMQAVLAAYNIRKPEGEYAVKRVLYTTRNIAKFEAAQEITRRTNQDLNLKVIVLKGTQKERKALILQAAQETGNVILVANYESVSRLSKNIQAFQPDAHIIDEVESLRYGKDTVRAPIIFGIKANYRIAISARLVVKGIQDLTEALIWTRGQVLFQGATEDHMRVEMKRWNADQFFDALDPVMVRWRRRIVMPEVGDPKQTIVEIEYGPKQDAVLRRIRTEFNQWLKKGARSDKKPSSDHIFRRFDLERRAAVDPKLVSAQVTEESPKLTALDEIIEAERKQQGKVVVLVDFVEEIESLQKRYNEKYGSGSAVGVSHDMALEDRNKAIWAFRSQAQPSVLIGTTFMLGSSLNLFQTAGAPFHISKMVLLSRPWRIYDAGERLVGVGQTHPAEVIWLLGKFRKTADSEGLMSIEEMQREMFAAEQNSFDHAIDGTPVLSEDEMKSFVEQGLGYFNDLTSFFTRSEVRSGSSGLTTRPSLALAMADKITRSEVRAGEVSDKVRVVLNAAATLAQREKALFELEKLNEEKKVLPRERPEFWRALIHAAALPPNENGAWKLYRAVSTILQNSIYSASGNGLSLSETEFRKTSANVTISHGKESLSLKLDAPGAQDEAAAVRIGSEIMRGYVPQELAANLRKNLWIRKAGVSIKVKDEKNLKIVLEERLPGWLGTLQKFGFWHGAKILDEIVPYKNARLLNRVLAVALALGIPRSEVRSFADAEQRGDYEKLTRFYAGQSVKEGMNEDGTLFVPSPLDVLPLIFNEIEHVFGKALDGRNYLALGAGLLHDSLYAASIRGMNVKAIERDAVLSAQAADILRSAQKQDLVTESQIQFFPASDAFDQSWSDVDVAYFFYTQSGGNRAAYRADFERRLLEKLAEMKPGSVFAMLFTGSQLMAEQADFDGLEPYFHDQAQLSFERTGLYLRTYKIPDNTRQGSGESSEGKPTAPQDSRSGRSEVRSFENVTLPQFIETLQRRLPEMMQYVEALSRGHQVSADLPGRVWLPVLRMRNELQGYQMLGMVPLLEEINDPYRRDFLAALLDIQVEEIQQGQQTLLSLKDSERSTAALIKIAELLQAQAERTAPWVREADFSGSFRLPADQSLYFLYSLSLEILLRFAQDMTSAGAETALQMIRMRLTALQIAKGMGVPTSEYGPYKDISTQIKVMSYLIFGEVLDEADFIQRVDRDKWAAVRMLDRAVDVFTALFELKLDAKKSGGDRLAGVLRVLPHGRIGYRAETALDRVLLPRVVRVVKGQFVSRAEVRSFQVDFSTEYDSRRWTKFGQDINHRLDEVRRYLERRGFRGEPLEARLYELSSRIQGNFEPGRRPGDILTSDGVKQKLYEKVKQAAAAERRRGELEGYTYFRPSSLTWLVDDFMESLEQRIKFSLRPMTGHGYRWDRVSQAQWEVLIRADIEIEANRLMDYRFPLSGKYPAVGANVLRNSILFDTLAATQDSLLSFFIQDLSDHLRDYNDEWMPAKKQEWLAVLETYISKSVDFFEEFQRAEDEVNLKLIRKLIPPLKTVAENVRDARKPAIEGLLVMMDKNFARSEVRGTLNFGLSPERLVLARHSTGHLLPLDIRGQYGDEVFHAAVKLLLSKLEPSEAPVYPHIDPEVMESIRVHMPTVYRLMTQKPRQEVQRLLEDSGRASSSDILKPENFLPLIAFLSARPDLEYTLIFEGGAESVKKLRQDLSLSVKKSKLGFDPFDLPNFKVLSAVDDSGVRRIITRSLSKTQGATAVVSRRAEIMNSLGAVPNLVRVQIKNPLRQRDATLLTASFLDELVQSLLTRFDEDSLSQRDTAQSILREVRSLQAFLTAA